MRDCIRNKYIYPVLISLQNIHKHFGSLHVLKGIDLTIKKGEVVSIVGPSGAGKTTLLQIIGTLEKSDEGTLKMGSSDLSAMSGKKLSAFRNDNIGFIFQFHNLLPEFTAIENVALPALIGGKSYEASMTRSRELLDTLGLTERAEHKPSELSGGEQQRVAVARALVNHPMIVLADEPSGNLDSQTAHDLHKLFFDLRKEFEQTFVIVTHNDDFADMADRKIVLQDGRIKDTIALQR